MINISMDKNLNIIAKELFGKIRTQFPKIKLGNEEGKVTSDPSEARFFEFDFIKDGVHLGSVTVSLTDDKMAVMYSNSIADDAPPLTKHQWFNFLKELREFAKQRLLNFDTRDITKSNLEKRDYEYLTKTNNGDGQMTESKLWGTNKTSFQNIGEARVVVRHTQPINNDIPGDRARHVAGIYIENAQGERFKYPFKHLNGARAMARHVANGGNPYDALGEHLISLSEELGKLRMFKGYVDRNEMVSEAMNAIHPKVVDRINEVKKQIQSLQSQKYYESFVENFQHSDAKEIPEEVMNDWIDRLTIRTFNEELKNVFPYIYKLVDESELPVKELTLEDIVTEDHLDAQMASAIIRGEKEIYDILAHPESPADRAAQLILQDMYDEVARDHRLHPDDDFEKIIDIMHDHIYQDYGNMEESSTEHFAEISEFEAKLDSITDGDGIFSDSRQVQAAAVAKLKELVAAEFPVGADGTNAIESLQGVISDDELNDIFRELADVDPQFDIRPIIQDYVKIKDEEHGTSVSSELGFDAAPAAAEEPPVEMPPEPQAAPAPVEPAPQGAVPQQPAPITASVDNDEDLDEEAFAESGTPASVLAKLARVVKSVETPEQLAAAQKFANLVFNKLNAKIVNSKGFAGLGDSTSLLHQIEADLKAKSREIGGGFKKDAVGMNTDIRNTQKLAGVTESLEERTDEILEFIESMFDKESGNFPKGETGVLLSVEKKFGDHAVPHAAKCIEHLRSITESYRLKRLAGLA